MRKFSVYMVVAAMCLISSTGVAGVINSQVDCTAPNKTGTAVGHDYEFDIPCTEKSKMVGGIEDGGKFDIGPGICGEYITPEDAPFNWDSPCGGSTVVAADASE